MSLRKNSPGRGLHHRVCGTCVDGGRRGRWARAGRQRPPSCAERPLRRWPSTSHRRPPPPEHRNARGTSPYRSPATARSAAGLRQVTCRLHLTARLRFFSTRLCDPLTRVETHELPCDVTIFDIDKRILEASAATDRVSDRDLGHLPWAWGVMQSARKARRVHLA